MKDNVKIYLNEEDREEFLSKLKADVDVSLALTHIISQGRR